MFNQPIEKMPNEIISLEFPEMFDQEINNFPEKIKYLKYYLFVYYI